MWNETRTHTQPASLFKSNCTFLHTQTHAGGCPLGNREITSSSDSELKSTQTTDADIIGPKMTTAQWIYYSLHSQRLDSDSDSRSLAFLRIRKFAPLLPASFSRSSRVCVCSEFDYMWEYSPTFYFYYVCLPELHCGVCLFVLLPSNWRVLELSSWRWHYRQSGSLCQGGLVVRVRCVYRLSRRCLVYDRWSY